MKRVRNKILYDAWRSAVYKRDGHKCQWPGCKKKKGLNAHHIRRWADNPSLRYFVDNGITLCYAHHKLVTGHELAYLPIFCEIVRGNNKRH
jgi:hypothetical protein